MHLPHCKTKEDVERAKEVVISLIYALIDSRRFRGDDYGDYDDGNYGDGGRGSGAAAVERGVL